MTGLSKSQQQETRLITEKAVADALIEIREELADMHRDIQALPNNETVVRLSHTVDRLLIIISGDEEISKEPGLIARVKTLELGYTTSLLQRAKVLGIWIGASSLVILIGKGILALIEANK